MRGLLIFIMGGISCSIFLLYFDQTQAANIQALTSIFIIASIFYAAKQVGLAKEQIHQNATDLEINHEWYRKQMAITDADTVNEDIFQAISEIDQEIKYSERQIDKAYSLKEMHSFICKVDNDSKLVKNDNEECILDDSKRSIRKNILKILNKYDKLATGIIQDIYDEETIKKSSKSAMMKSFSVFELYISFKRLLSKRYII